METKKQLGQHWLFDAAALDAMVAAAEVKQGDTVLEIGPGLGTLTERLLAAGATVHAVEYDRELLVELKAKFAKTSQFILSNEDILKFDFTKLPSGYKAAANIPYYLTSNLLRIMTESNNPFSRAALLVQKEVAERVCAQPGGMSLLSVAVQFYCRADLGEIVPADLFTPPPKVDSRILILDHTGPRFEVEDRAKFFRLVKAGFSERRKKLRSSLSSGLGISKAQAEELLGKAGIDANLRAQALSLDDWHRLYLSAC